MTLKKRTKIILTTIFILSVLTALHFYFGLFTTYNYITAKWDIAHNRPRILQYGEAMETDEQAFKLAPKFGFIYDIVANCIVTTPIVNGINTYNTVTIKYLTDKHGKDWKKKFDFSVDSLFRVDRVDTIRKTILAIDNIKQMDNYLDSVSNGKRHLYIWVLPQEKNEPNVKVGEIMPDSSIRVFYYFQVDPYSLQVSTIQY
jgi:hypothetical protein